jgi:hypothetical protein
MAPLEQHLSITASVDNVTREATITVDSTPTPTGGAA